MNHFASVPLPLDIDDVQRVRASGDEIRLRLSGRWLAAEPPSASDEALLVVQIDGRRHRFTPGPEERPGAPGRWAASFVVPGWAEPRRDGQAAVWIGEAVIPVPAVGASPRWPSSGPPALGSAVAADAPERPAELRSGPPPEPPTELPSEAPRSGPLADLLLKETVAALHGELEARSAESARLRSALTGARSELEARSDSQGALEGTLGELGTELRRLMAAVEEQRVELERRDAHAAREREELERRDADAVREREELERRLVDLAGARDAQAAELAAIREQHTTAIAALREEHAAALGSLREEQAGELRDLHAQLASAQAAGQRRLADTAALREELASAQVARQAARGETAGLQSELERIGAELAVTRERVDSETGDLGEANRLLADARALAAQLRARPDGG